MQHPFHEFPKHLFHAKFEPRIANNKEEEDRLRRHGYTEHYVHQEYPKAVAHDPETGVAVIARDAAHEAELMGASEDPDTE